jgi:thiaminase
MTKSLIESTSALWRQYVEHKFVKDLGRGILDKSHFVHFIKCVSMCADYVACSHHLLDRIIIISNIMLEHMRTWRFCHLYPTNVAFTDF